MPFIILLGTSLSMGYIYGLIIKTNPELKTFWSVGDRKRGLSTVMLIYRHDMNYGLQ